MKFSIHRLADGTLRIGLTLLCLLAIWYSVLLAYGDHLFHKDTPEALRAAIRVVPDDPVLYMRLSQLAPNDARELLETALRLDRYNAQASIELALRSEADGDYQRAEQLLLNAYAIDRTYLPRWSLANFYFRRDNEEAFWKWAKSAASMPSDHVAPLFALCWHATDDPNVIAAKILNDNPDLLRQYVDFLVTKGKFQAATGIANRLIQHGDPRVDVPQLLTLVNRMVEGGDGTSAKAVWTDMIAHHWIIADNTVPNNPEFNRKPLPVSFDWTIEGAAGMRSEVSSTGLQVELTGDQPESAAIAYQRVVLEPGKYTLQYSYQTQGIAPGSGLQWEMYPAGEQTVLFTSPSLSSETETQNSVAFEVPQGTNLFEFQLVSRRQMGTTRASGTAVVKLVKIVPR